MRLRPKNLHRWEDVVWRLVFRYGFWFMLAFCIVLFILFATGMFAQDKLGLRRLFGCVIVGYLAVCMALMATASLRLGLSECRGRDTRTSLWAMVFPWMFGGLLLTGSIWIFWRIFVP